MRTHWWTSRRRHALITVLALVAAGGGLARPAGGQDEGPAQAEPLRSDSRAPYVHRITLYDHDGTVIDPSDELAGPYSPRMTCGKCHPYARISSGWHFNASDPEVPPGRPGEPWFLVDPQTGTQFAVSYRKWPGTFTPEAVGLSNWDMVVRFGRHIPGGGFGEPSDEDVQASPKALRWGISGKLEIDCMFCHAADQQHDPAEAARQIERENFKWAPTAALGLAVIRGDAAKAPDDWDPLLPPDPDFPERAGPKIVWDQTRFDPDDRVLFNITRRVPNERCYFCHSFRQVGSDAEHELVVSQDVHLAAGLTCVDCHRNQLDHRTVRGYAIPTAEESKRVLESSSYEILPTEIARDAYSCRGCHLGTEGWGEGSPPIGNRYGAPHPQHGGLPPLHFEKLTCTACHSGPWPQMDAKRFQTALAHGLGLATRDRTDDDPPHIVGPVFARQHDGKIAPQRMVWVAQRAGAGENGKPGASDYRWSIAHDVRPASQALGVRGCTDCHSDDAPIFFGRIAAAGDAGAEARPVQLMYELRGDDPALAKAWDVGFRFRPAFKWFGFVCGALVALVLLHYLLRGLDVVLRRFR